MDATTHAGKEWWQHARRQLSEQVINHPGTFASRSDSQLFAAIVEAVLALDEAVERVIELETELAVARQTIHNVSANWKGPQAPKVTE